jgi:hypothetical protein
MTSAGRVARPSIEMLSRNAASARSTTAPPTFTRYSFGA